MTQEEKAKAYDNIIEKANKMHSENCEACQMCIEELIPELKDSDDERISKALVKYFTSSIENPDYEICGVPFKKVLAWLEQLTGWLYGHVGVLNGGQKKYAEWLSSLKDKVLPQPKQEWSEDDVRNIQDIDSVLFYDKNLPEDSRIRLRNWLRSLKRRVQPQSKWSEEDKRILTTLINYLEEHGGGIDGYECIFLADWLKSLKPQSQWKPSKEQLETFEYYLDADISNKDKEVLIGLYNQLKQF